LVLGPAVKTRCLGFLAVKVAVSGVEENGRDVFGAILWAVGGFVNAE
jgi:hypothetical protein